MKDTVITILENQQNPSIRSDGQVFYRYDEIRRVWYPLLAKEVLREIRSVFLVNRGELNTAANARRIYDEIRSSERFYFPVPVKKSLPYIVMQTGRINILTKKLNQYSKMTMRRTT